MFQHWIFWLVVTLLVLAVLLVAKERGFRDKINGSINGTKRWLGFDPEWWAVYFNCVAVAVGIVGLGLIVFA